MLLSPRQVADQDSCTRRRLLVRGAGRESAGDERADEAHEDADGRDSDGEDHGVPAAGHADGGSEDEGGAGSFGERSEEIGTHTGHISNVVSDVVGDGGGVARVILGDAVDNLLFLCGCGQCE